MAISTSSINTKGFLLDSDKDWYHGELTREQAERALKENQDSNCFLIRESRNKDSLVVSFIHKRGEFCHWVIYYDDGQYRLQSEPPEKVFSKLDDLVSYYRGGETIPEVACKKTKDATGKLNEVEVMEISL